MAMFNRTRTPIKVGSLMRSRHMGSRIVIVTDISNNVVTVKSYGSTYWGAFTSAKRPRIQTGYPYIKGDHVIFKVNPGGGWSGYVHVVKGDGKPTEQTKRALRKQGYDI